MDASLAAAAQLTKRPVYGMGGSGAVQVGAFRERIGVLRSWQHKAARRSSAQNTAELLTCVQIQVAAGFFSAASDYFGTIFLEDVGIAGVEYFAAVAFLRAEVRKISQRRLPLGASVIQQLLERHRQLVALVAHCPRSRLIPEMSAIALLSMPKCADYAALADTLPARIAACRAQGVALSRTGPEITAAAQALTAALLAGRPTKNIWTAIGFSDAPVVRALRDMYGTAGTSDALCIHAALWTVCFRLESVAVGVLPPSATALLPEPWTVPKYAYDKHVMRVEGGGYREFFEEGTKCDADKRAWREDDDALRERSFALRMEYESKHGPGSSKSCKVFARLQNAAKAASTRKRPAEDLNASIIMQQITGRAKKMVFYHVDHVLKGPYVNDEPRLQRNLRVAAQIRAIDAARGVPATVLEGPEVVHRPEGVFLKWPNVGRAVENPATRVIANVIMRPMRVVDRGAVVDRVSDLREPTDALIVQTLNHLYSRALVLCGDSGTFNVLVTRDGRAVGIDLEDERKDFAHNDALQILFSKLPAHAERYRAQLRNIVRLTRQQAGQLLEERAYTVWERLENLLA